MFEPGYSKVLTLCRGCGASSRGTEPRRRGERGARYGRLALVDAQLAVTCLELEAQLNNSGAFAQFGPNVGCDDGLCLSQLDVSPDLASSTTSVESQACSCEILTSMSASPRVLSLPRVLWSNTPSEIVSESGPTTKLKLSSLQRIISTCYAYPPHYNDIPFG